VEELANSWLADLHARASVVRNLLPDPQAREILGGDTVLFVNGQAVSVLAFGSALMSEFGDRLIGPCIERILIFQEAKRRGIVASEDEVRKRTEAICERLFQERAAEEGMSREEFAARLEESGIQPAEYKTRLAGELVPPDDVRATLLAEKMAGDEIEVSDQDVQLAYQARYGQRVDVRCMGSGLTCGASSWTAPRKRRTSATGPCAARASSCSCRPSPLTPRHGCTGAW